MDEIKIFIGPVYVRSPKEFAFSVPLRQTMTSPGYSGGSRGTNQMPKNAAAAAEEEEEGLDRISVLPDGIIHKIFTLLQSQKQAAKTSVMSKRWADLWRSYPILEFDPAELRSKQSAEEFAAAAAKKFSSSSDLSMEALRILTDPYASCDWGEEFSSALLDGLLDLAASKSVQEIKIFPWFEYDPSGLIRGGRSFRCLKVLHLYILNFELCTNNIGASPLAGIGSSLTELYLKHAWFWGDDQILNNTIAAAPLLQKLTLDAVFGVRRLQVRSRASLKSIRLFDCEVEDLEITGAHSLEALHVARASLGGDLLVSSMPSLKILNISNVRKLTEEKLNKLISKCPSLESLMLTNPQRIHKLKLASYDRPPEFRLNVLYPEPEQETVIEIDAPKLRKVCYEGRIPLSPPIIFGSSSGSCSEDDDHRQPHDGAVSFSWKLCYSRCHNLRQSLYRLSHFRLTLDFSALELGELSFEVENEVHVPLIEHVKLPWNFWTLHDKDTFLGHLFHNCRPKYLSFTDKRPSDQASKHSVLLALQYICNGFKERDSTRYCRTSTNNSTRYCRTSTNNSTRYYPAYSCNCWRYQLRDVKTVMRVTNDGDGAGDEEKLIDISTDVFSSLEVTKTLLSLTWD